MVYVFSYHVDTMRSKYVETQTKTLAPFLPHTHTHTYAYTPSVRFRDGSATSTRDRRSQPTQTQTHTHMHMYMHECVRIYICMHACNYVCITVYAENETHTHTHTFSHLEQISRAQHGNSPDLYWLPPGGETVSPTWEMRQDALDSIFF